jgi:hypothetical protein
MTTKKPKLPKDAAKRELIKTFLLVLLNEQKKKLN